MIQTAQPNVDTIFCSAIEIESSTERQAFLNNACGNDIEVRHQVERLIQAHFRGGSVLDSPALLRTATINEFSERIGTLIGPYKLLEQIGEGGMGVVYMAQQTQPVKRRVALKVIKPGMDSRQVVARFEAERQALAMMDHSNIARVLDAGTTDGGLPFFVMELVRGIAITDYCDREKLDTRRRLELFADVCRAVQHAHQKAIIHRDLKPSNVLITLHDGVPVVKVIDFGVAKALNQELTERTLFTQFSQMIGTPLYMSPEQAELSGLDIDTRSDIYSLGVLLYELLTGTTPFDKATLSAAGFDEMRRIIREEEPPRPSARVSTLQAQELSTISERRNADPRRISIALRGELDWVVMKALEKERSRRYESASALAADIQRYLADEQVLACPPSTAYRFRKFARKNKTAITTLLLVAASLLLGITLSLWQALRATAAEAQATANEAKANEAAAAEAQQRQRAEANEQKALAAAATERAAKESEAEQRKQAENNFDSALEAVDRMLANVNDPELNDVPRVGPLRRKMLRDAIAFYERIPLVATMPQSTHYRVAQTWHRIAEAARKLDEVETSIQAFHRATAQLESLVRDQPKRIEFRNALAGCKHDAAWVNFHQLHRFDEAEGLFLGAHKDFSELSDLRPQQRSFVAWQAHTLHGAAQAAEARGKRDEAIGHLSRALDLLRSTPAAGPYDLATFLATMARFQAKGTPSDADRFFRQSIAEFRDSPARKSGNDRNQYAVILGDAGKHFGVRFFDEAEKLFDESIAAWREITGPSPQFREGQWQIVNALLNQMNHLRRVADQPAASDEAQRRSSKAAKLAQEALTEQRRMVSRFTLEEDRIRLVELLHDEAKYLLSKAAQVATSETAPSNASKADALLTEAIQLCRALAAEFPDNTKYKNRLAALLKLQAQHFGQPKAAETKP
jgi:serine/threonine protein kinase